MSVLPLLLSFLCALLLSHTSSASYTGIWCWTWSSTSAANHNLHIAFSGYTDPSQALSSSTTVLSQIKTVTGEHYISLGGGNANGRWTKSFLSSITSYCSQKKFAGYSGISFDIEEGDSGLLASFQTAFSTCKRAGYKVLVTVSHSTPYGLADKVAVMTGIIGDANVDILSPQLYTSGSELQNDYTTNGVAWSEYKNFKGQGGIVPSIVEPSLYPAAQTYFKGMGITLNGYIRWSQQSTSVTVRCGTDWSSANNDCTGKACAVDADCPSGQHCYNALLSCTGSALTDDSAQQSNSLSDVQLGLIVLGCVLFVAILVVVVVVVVRKQRRTEAV